MLSPDLQDLLNHYTEMCKRVSALRVINAEQEQRIELEHEQSKKADDKLKDMMCWITKRENHYKMCLNNLEMENKKLRCDLVDVQRECKQAGLANEIKISGLQDEIELLRAQITQLCNEHKQQLILQNKQLEDEISKYKYLLKSATAKSVRGQNVANKSKNGILKKHPALTDEEERQETKRFSELDVCKVAGKRRRLFQNDNDTAVDII